MSTNHFDVIIIGAGLSGIGAACHLIRNTPTKTYTILESREGMGGTWDLFRYPGIRSDSDMHTLGYSFKPWKHEKSIADGPTILNYIRETANEYNVEQSIQYQMKVKKINWDSNSAKWTLSVSLNGGEEAVMTCDFIYSCTGYYRYDKGYTPDFVGINRFKGRIVHPQQWPEDLDYSGKNVVVIGSGATAITLVPAMAKLARHVTMLQRSPTYVISSPDKDRMALKFRRLLPDQIAYILTRWKNIAASMIFYKLSKRWPHFIGEKLIEWTKHQLGKDFDVDKHFSPSYKPWDQRLCLVPNGDLFRSLREGTSSVVTDHITEFRETGIELRSGATIEADIIITATGLELLAMGGVEIIVDGNEIDVADTTQYKGVMLSDVPNFFFATGYTNASWTLKCDLTSEYVCRMINYLDKTNQSSCVPRNKDVGLQRVMSIGLESGYVQRAIHKLPKEGVIAPWKLYQNYFLDLIGLRFGSVKDKYIEFSKASIND